MNNATLDKIAAMDDEELGEYFADNASYDWRNAPKPYGIRFGVWLFSNDTHDLAKRFRAAVKRHRERSAPKEALKT